MSKFWLVAAHEYRRHVLRKRFLIGLLSMPLLVAFTFGLGILTVYLGTDTTPIGMVDPANLFPNPQQVPEDEEGMFGNAPVVVFSDESRARAALDAGQIQAFYVLSDTYLENGQARLVSKDTPADNVSGDFSSFLRYNLLLNAPADVRDRLSVGIEFVTRNLDGSRSAGKDNWISLVLPFASGLVFMIAVTTSGNYLMQAVVEEKENRTMEIIVTSVSPYQLIAGKTTGNLGVGLTQLLIWIGVALIAVLLAGNVFPSFQSFSLSSEMMIIMLVTFLPAFVLVGALLAAIGSITTELREAQQYSGLLTLPFFIPYWFVTPLIMNPNSPLSLGLSLFPFTAPVALPIRAAFTEVPAWQVIVAASLLFLCAAGAVWLAVRTFRLGMLQYGKRLSFRTIFGRVKA